MIEYVVGDFVYGHDPDYDCDLAGTVEEVGETRAGTEVFFLNELEGRFEGKRVALPVEALRNCESPIPQHRYDEVGRPSLDVGRYRCRDCGREIELTVVPFTKEEENEAPRPTDRPSRRGPRARGLLGPPASDRVVCLPRLAPRPRRPYAPHGLGGVPGGNVRPSLQ